MVASRHSEDGNRVRLPSSAAAGAARATAMGPDTGPIESLLAKGTRLRLRAPELAMVFGERAAALAEAAGSERLWAYAEGLSVFARIRLGQRASVVNRAVTTLRAAEADGYDDLAIQMRTELALCARTVGVPLTGLAALRPVLDSDDLPAAARSAALLQLVGCMAPLGRRGVLDRALSEAEELAAADTTLDDNDRTVLRAMVCARSAAHLRRYCDLEAAMESARKGLDLIEGLEEGVDGVQMRVRLGLELVSALLDRGAEDEAIVVADTLLASPHRAASAGPMSWLRLAIATRVLLPSGSAEAAGMMVRDALYSAERHGLRALSARLWLDLSHIEERLGRPSEAVRCLNQARMDEHANGRVRRQALGLLIGEFGRGEHHIVDVHGTLGGHRSRDVPSPRVADTADHAEQAAPPAEPEPSGPSVTESPAPAEPSVAEEAAAEVPDEPETEAGAEPHPVPDAVEDPQDGGSNAASRHRSAGTASARSMLERLGVTVGSGGKRRAPDDPEGTEHEDDTAGSDAEEVDSAEAANGVVTGAGPEKATGTSTSGRKDLDSVLAVFSNWTDEDDADAGGAVRPAPRVRRHRKPMSSGEPIVPNRRVVNGDDSVAGRHRGER